MINHVRPVLSEHIGQQRGVANIAKHGDVRRATLDRRQR